MKKVLGIDLGTNSIGWAIREIGSLDNQIIHKGVLTFEKGVGEEQGQEVALVQTRTKSRRARRNYQAKKYRKWEMLETLILNEPQLCPLTIEELDLWRKYEKGKKRIYPQSKLFINWLRLDFNGDGKADYKNPYELRKLASEEKIRDNYALGRVFYHLVQRRGFRGRDEEEAKTILEGSKEKETAGANEVQKIINDEKKSLGSALFLLQEKYHKRIRNRYNLRTDVEAELRIICKAQGIDENSNLFRSLFRSIIWQRPLRTQKGNIGRCTFEPSKPRCPISHPLFEEFRMWVFLNNIRIRYKNESNNNWLPLSKEQKELVVKNVFFGKKKNKDNFEFTEIVKALDKKGDILNFNYKPYTSVSGCPIIFSLQEIFGCDFYKITIPYSKNKKGGKEFYDFHDLWHVLFTFDSKERLEIFAKEKLLLDDDKAKLFSKIRVPKGYSSLSLNAIKKILYFLRKGFIYSESIYLANLDKVFNRNLSDEEINKILEGIHLQIRKHKLLREEISIVNSLISDYLAKPEEEQIARHPSYTLLKQDLDLLEKKILEHFTNKRWEELEEVTKKEVKGFVEKKYLEFLQTPNNSNIKLLYYKLPRLDDLIKNYLKKELNINEQNLKYLYHPSETEIYKPAVEINQKRYLGDPIPISRGFKNPMAIKTLYYLKRLINYLIKEDKIDEETRVVVEIARELNDANKRKAIENWQRKREAQNMEFEQAIKEFAEQQNKSIEITDLMIDKYRLWIEQGRQCIYTGKMISLSELLDGNEFDLEHTIPADVSFDNELKNLTIADTVFNRQVKKKRIPADLPNYEKDVEIDGVMYTAILPRIEFMKNKVENFKKQVEYWKKEAKKALSKDRKDYCIQQRHYNQFELEYWSKKFNTFTIKEFNPIWRNSQLRDTQIITKYAFHYLRTVFNRVEVQKGTVVAEFRKIFKIGFEKDRSKHTHHAIDATVLTLIPSPSIRDRILKEHFDALEKNLNFHSQPLDWKNFNPSIIKEIENDTLVNFIKQDRTLVPAKKIFRKRGKIQYVKEKLENGKWQYKLDENGKRIPIIAQGDSLRGQLHKQTFYGAIMKSPDKDDLLYVVRKSIGDFKSEKEFEDIVDPAVKKTMINIVKERIQNGKSFKEAISEPIWLIDSDGNFKKTDRNGNVILPIRHIRCKARAGNGYFTKALQLKEHTFKSEKEHKQMYYVQNELNYLLLLYSNHIDKSVQRTSKIINLLDLTQLKIKNSNQLFNMQAYNTLEKGKKKGIYHLTNILKVGQRVLLWNECPEEIYNMERKDLLRRLYKIYKFNEISVTTYIYLIHHNEARQEKELPNPDKNFEINRYQPYLRLTPQKLNCLFEGTDFEIMIDGEIIMKK